MSFRLFVATAILMSSMPLWAADPMPNSAEKTEAAICSEDSPFCQMYKAGQTLDQQVCEYNFKLLGCDQFLERNPQAKDKLNYCPSTKRSKGKTIADYALGCAEGFRDGYSDLLTMIPKLVGAVFKDHSLDQKELDKLDFLRDCETPECKRKMLGDFVYLFKDQDKNTYSAIDGVTPRDPKVNCGESITDKTLDEASKNYCYGYSATELFRQMVIKLSPQIANKTMSDQWVPAWNKKHELEQIPHFTSMETRFKDMFGTRYQCYDDEHAANLTCYMLTTVLLPGAAAKVTEKAIAYAGVVDAQQAELAAKLRAAETVDVDKLPSGVDTTPHGSGEIGELTPERKQFLGEMKPDGKNPEFNMPEGFVRDEQAYLDKTQNMKPAENRAVWEADNKEQKTLNDTLQRPDYVDALNNKFKSMLLGNLKNFKNKYPNLDVTVYSDWKSIRFLFETKSGRKIPAELSQEMNEIYQATLKDYAQYLKDNKLVYGSDDPTLWFRSGMGQNAERSTLAARLSRVVNNTPHTAVFEDPIIERHVRNNLQTAVSIGHDLDRRFPALFESENGLRLPTTDAINIIRKYSNAEEIQNILVQEYHLKKFSRVDAQRFQNYVQRLNQFTPSVRAVPGPSASLVDTGVGGFYTDIPAQGSENIKAVARAAESLFRKGVDPEKIGTERMVQELRKQDTIATAVFDGRKAEIKATAQSTLGPSVEPRMSGDEGAIPPGGPISVEKQKEFFDKAAKTVKGNGLRATYVNLPKNTVNPASQLDNIGKLALDQEKVLRAEVRGLISVKKLDNIQISSTVSVDQKIKFEFRYRNDSGEKLTETEERFLKAHMQKIEDEPLKVKEPEKEERKKKPSPYVRPVNLNRGLDFDH